MLISKLINFDLLSVGISIAAIIILGFAVFFNNRQSITNRSFLAFSFVTSAWGIVNYLNYQVSSATAVLWMLRFVMFFAVWQAFTFFQFAFVFPLESYKFTKLYTIVLIPSTVIVSIMTLTPLLFSRIIMLSSSGTVSDPDRGPGIIFFAILSVGLIIAGTLLLLRKLIHEQESIKKKQIRMILIGLTLMFCLIIVFNFILPAYFHILQYMPFGSLFILPFIVAVFYAIRRHEFLNMKILSTEILTFILAVVSFIEVVIAKDFLTIVFRSGVFILILSFGILLIRSVLREVRQRETLEVLSKELEASNEKLKVADRMKSQFLSFASHQVKSPMTVVKDYAELICEDTYGQVPDKVKETAEKIKTVANRLIELVTNLLDLRKLEEGKIEYRFEFFDINALVKQSVEELKSVAESKQLVLSCESPADEIKIKGDKEKIRQVIQNLIDNSIKYTEHGWIKVAVHTARDTVRVSVSDSGIGIPKDLIPQLFEQFNRGSDAAKKIQGTGLGLYIAKQFVEAHHGKVWGESPGPGKGSAFILELSTKDWQ